MSIFHGQHWCLQGSGCLLLPFPVVFYRFYHMLAYRFPWRFLVFHWSLRLVWCHIPHLFVGFSGRGLCRFPLPFLRFHFLGVHRRHLPLYSLVGIQSWSIWFPAARGLLCCCFLLCSWLLFQIIGFLHLLICCWFCISLSICIPLLRFGLHFSFCLHGEGNVYFLSME